MDGPPHAACKASAAWTIGACTFCRRKQASASSFWYAALWLLATNFENNLIFMLCFLLLALFVVSIHFTHGTLSGLRVKPVRAQSVFKGDAAAVELSFSQVRARRREQVVLRFAGGEPLMVTLEKAGDTFVTVLAPTTRRGYLDPGLLTVESVYPVGLMRVWTYIHFRFDAAVYPAPCTGSGARFRSTRIR